MMSVKSALQLPKEHGSWGMFYVPMVLGFAAAARWTPAIIPFVIAASAAFLTREPLMAFWRTWRRKLDSGRSGRMLAIYTAIAAAAGLPLIAHCGLTYLIPMGVAGAAMLLTNAELAMRGKGRTPVAEILAIGVSALTAPAAHYVALHRLTLDAAWLWLASFAYFTSSVFYVKMRVTAAHARKGQDPSRARFQCGLYHVLLAAAIVALAGSGTMPWIAALAFAPICVRAFLHFAYPTRELNLKQVGWTEMVYSLAFMALLAAAV
jgi:hypothetical protein